MKPNEFIDKVKELFKEVDVNQLSETEEGKEDPDKKEEGNEEGRSEEKFADFRTQEGDIVRVEDKDMIEEGDELKKVTDEGLIPVEEGEHILEDGTSITVSEGVVNSISKPSGDEEGEGSGEAPPNNEEMSEDNLKDLKQKIEDLKNDLESVKGEKFKEIKDKNEELEKKVEELSKQPGGDKADPKKEGFRGRVKQEKKDQKEKRKELIRQRRMTGNNRS